MRRLTRLTSIVVGARVIIALLTRTFFQPDEYFQSLEPAHHIVYGYGHLTWEWRNDPPIRSILYPALNVPLYWALKIAGLESWIVIAPKILHGALAAMTDISLCVMTRRVLGERYVSTVLLLSLSSFFNALSLSRSLSNSLETSLSSIAYSYYPWNDTLDMADKYRKNIRQCLIFAALACAVRPTNAVIWGYLFAYLLWTHGSNKAACIAIISEVITIGASTLSFVLVVDRLYYGKWTFTPFHFIFVNLSGISLFYGSNPWHYYLLQAFPVLCTTAVPFVIHGVWSHRHDRTLRAMINIILWTVLIYSLAGHKEWRFIHPLLPLFHLFAAKSLVDLSTTRSKDKSRKLFPIRRRYLIFLLLTVPVSLYTTLFYCSAPISVMSYLRSLPDEDLKGSVGFLMPCHSTPAHAYLHRPILNNGLLWFIGCEPPLSQQDGQTYQDQTTVFYQSPYNYLIQRFPPTVNPKFPISPFPASIPGRPDPYFAPWRHEWPRYLVFFGELLHEEGVEELLRDQGYQEVWKRGRAWEGDGSKRKGGVRVWKWSL